MNIDIARFYANGLVTAFANTNNGSLFHYTKRDNAFCSILKNGFRFSYNFEEHNETIAKCLDKTSVKYAHMIGAPKIQYGMAVPMICFCDIPIARASNHRQTYGSYCIGIDKEKCRKVLPALNPILYTSSSWIESVFERLVDFLPTKEEDFFREAQIKRITVGADNPIQGAGLIKKAEEDGTLSDNIKYDSRFKSAIIELLSILKPYEHNGNCYYNEHEWRIYFTPAGFAKGGLTKEEFEKEKDNWNNELWDNKEYGYITFDNPQDIITHLIVPDDKDIHPLVVTIRESESIFGRSLLDEQKSLLISKITSFERIACDI